jgi:type IV pilus assembly protein PilN
MKPILINLLPHREEARKRRKEQFWASAIAAVVLGAACLGLGFLILQSQMDAQHTRNAFLEAETAKLDLQIKDIATLQLELDSLKARQAAVEGLQSDRNIPVHLLAELVKQVPDGVHLDSMKQQGKVVVLTGVAQSQERVSELLRNLTTQSSWLYKPELVEIVSAMQTVSGKEQRRLSNFTVRANIGAADAVEKQSMPVATP